MPNPLTDDALAQGRKLLAACRHPNRDTSIKARIELVAWLLDHDLLGEVARLREAIEIVRPYFEGEHAHDHPACVAIREVMAGLPLSDLARLRAGETALREALDQAIRDIQIMNIVLPPGTDATVAVVLTRIDAMKMLSKIRAALAAPSPAPKGGGDGSDFVSIIRRQAIWSRETFGPDRRTAGNIDHIRKELREIEAVPTDIEEWVDVAMLAIDGAWRAGATPAEIVAQYEAKLAKNMARQWPDWRTLPETAIEHVKTAAPPQRGSGDGREEGNGAWIAGWYQGRQRPEPERVVLHSNNGWRIHEEQPC